MALFVWSIFPARILTFVTTATELSMRSHAEIYTARNLYSENHYAPSRARKRKNVLRYLQKIIAPGASIRYGRIDDATMNSSATRERR